MSNELCMSVDTSEQKTQELITHSFVTEHTRCNKSLTQHTLNDVYITPILQTIYMD